VSVAWGGGLVGLGVGAAAGLAYWRFIGCATGACPLTSQWWTSMLYGALLGLLVGGVR
jgi:hypothetical protein